MIGRILTPRFIFITVTVLAAALMRLLPHPPNFAPIAAIALLGGALYADKKTAFIVPIAAMLLSDLFLPDHGTKWAVYLAFMLIVVIGFTLRERLRVSSLMLASLTSSILFFLLTNFAVWLGSPYYPQDIAGLLACLWAGVPFYSNDIFGSFFLNTIMGDLFFTGLLFGAYHIAQLNFPQLAKIHVKK